MIGCVILWVSQGLPYNYSACQAMREGSGSIQYEPRCEKTSLRGFRPGRTQTGLYNHTRWLEA